MESVQFIRYTGSAAAAAKEASSEEVVHAHFSIEGSQRLFLRELTSPQAGVIYLGHRILENPSDLKSHVQRILLLLEQEAGPELQGALIDLYIALGDKGTAIKERMIEQATPHLSRTAAVLFRQRLLTGFKPWENSISRVRASLLSLGYSGVHDLVRRRASGAASGYSDALAEARSCLEYGQVEEAREVLEQALRLEPENAEVAGELLLIYRHTRDEERLAAMRNYLQETLPRLPDGWDA